MHYLQNIDIVEMPLEKKEDDAPPVASNTLKFLKIAFKLLELVLILLCIGLFDDPANSPTTTVFLTPRTIQICYATFGTFTIFTSVYILMQIANVNYSWKTAVVMSFIGIVMFLTCACMILTDWSSTKLKSYWPPNKLRLDLVCATGAITIVLTFLHLIDLIFTIFVGIKYNVD